MEFSAQDPKALVLYMLAQAKELATEHADLEPVCVIMQADGSLIITIIAGHWMRDTESKTRLGLVLRAVVEAEHGVAAVLISDSWHVRLSPEDGATRLARHEQPKDHPLRGEAIVAHYWGKAFPTTGVATLQYGRTDDGQRTEWGEIEWHDGGHSIYQGD